ncbi:MAG: LytR/AlgR family response regulator transcription factor [Gammaproteobacteria bacterium]
MINALLVDDEELARRGLTLRLADYPDIEVCGNCRNGHEAIEAVSKQKPDVVFLDIQMPGMDGFEVARQLAGSDMPAIIFVTAYDQFALQAFEAHALDYLLKPINANRLEEAIIRLRANMQTKQAPVERQKLLDLVCRLTGKELTLDEALKSSKGRYPSKLELREGTGVIFVDVDDVEWIDAAGDYMCLHAGGETHIIRTTMKNFETQLDPERFVRIHRSTLVNWNCVVKVKPYKNGDYDVHLKNGSPLRMSRTYAQKLKPRYAPS